MLREELYIFSEPNDKLTYYKSGAGAIAFNDTTKEWTLSNPGGATVFLQYTTDFDLNIGDSIEVEFIGSAEGIRISTRTEVIGGIWSDGYPLDNRPDSYSNLKRMKIPVKKKGKHIISVGLPSATIGTAIVKNLKIKINTDATRPPVVEKLHAKIFNNTANAPATWERYSFQTTGDNCTVTKFGTFGIQITFSKSLSGKGCAFVSVESGNNGFNYKVQAQDVTANTVYLYFYNPTTNAQINPSTIADKIFLNLLLM